MKFDVALVLGFYAIGSAVVLVKTFTRKPSGSYSRAGWGNTLSALPDSWQLWLLDERDDAARRNIK